MKTTYAEIRQLDPPASVPRIAAPSAQLAVEEDFLRLKLAGGRRVRVLFAASPMILHAERCHC